jgi:ATP-dependent DNA helicase RecQ
MGELLEEIEAIVNSGTRLNIDYYINSILDEDVVDDIYTYFKEDAETDSIEEAMKELDDTGYSEEEVRLVRIKFISEMGN